MTSEQYIADLKDALKKLAGVRPVGQEYIRLVNDTVLGGLDYLGQSVTRAMYSDLWTWLNENQPSRILSESDWQAMYTSQNGNVPYYSSGDGSTTFRLPRVVGYFKGAGTVSEVGQYTAEGLPNITGNLDVTPDADNAGMDASATGGGAIKEIYSTGSGSDVNGTNWTVWKGFSFDASLSNPIYGASDHVTPETVTVVMGVIAFGSVARIGEATEEGIVAELGEHGAKLGELESSVAKAVPAGFVMPFAANSTPAGYLLCNGAAVSRTTYAALFAAIGTTYGTGDGSTTFNLPNLTNKFIQGSGTAGTVKAAGLPNITGTFEPSDGRGGAATGAFYKTSYSGWKEKGTEGTDYTWKFDASRSNAIYGASTTVQPPALTMRYYIKY